jgi:hypothetical protein
MDPPDLSEQFEGLQVSAPVAQSPAKNFDILMAKIRARDSPENRWAMQTLEITNYDYMIKLLESRDLNKLKKNLCAGLFYSQQKEQDFAVEKEVTKWAPFVKQLREFATNPASQHIIYDSHASAPAPEHRPGSPVLGPVQPMPFPIRISREAAAAHQAAVNVALADYKRDPRSRSVSRGGKSRSKQRGRKSRSKQRGRKSTHKKRR